MNGLTVLTPILMTISVKLDIYVSAVQYILLNLTIDLINSLGSLHISTPYMEAIPQGTITQSPGHAFHYFPFEQHKETGPIAL